MYSSSGIWQVGNETRGSVVLLRAALTLISQWHETSEITRRSGSCSRVHCLPIQILKGKSLINKIDELWETISKFWIGSWKFHLKLGWLIVLLMHMFYWFPLYSQSVSGVCCGGHLQKDRRDVYVHFGKIVCTLRCVLISYGFFLTLCSDYRRFGLFFPYLPLQTFSGEIWSWNLVGTNVWPRISGNVRGIQVQPLELLANWSGPHW